MLADALAVQEAGAFAIVLELVPDQLSAAITERLRIPTIGIGAGPHCSGEVQVITDLLGMTGWQPRHLLAEDVNGTLLGAAQWKWLAEQLGVTEPVISRWKSGESFPKNADHIELLAEIMNVPVWLLFVEGGVEDPMEALSSVSDQLRNS